MACPTASPINWSGIQGQKHKWQLFPSLKITSSNFGSLGSPLSEHVGEEDVWPMPHVRPLHCQTLNTLWPKQRALQECRLVDCFHPSMGCCNDIVWLHRWSCHCCRMRLWPLVGSPRPTS